MTMRRTEPLPSKFAGMCLMGVYLVAGLLFDCSSATEPLPHDGVRFIQGKECGLCHAFSERAQAMRDNAGKNIAPYDLWSGSMMANSARDPYWRAVLAAELEHTPKQRDHIAELCTRCHAPMSPATSDLSADARLAILQSQGPEGHLSQDGVSCTVCHQISKQNLGTEQSFTGGFEFNTQGIIYGPHKNPVAMPMQRHVGYTPVDSEHIRSSALCATCHTVITHSFNEEEIETEHRLHEQSPYLEWRNSDFSDESPVENPQSRSCQDCHMPNVDSKGHPIATRIAHNPGGRDFPFLQPRAPFGQHSFAGGNVFMTRLLRNNRGRLGVQASVDSLDLSIAASSHMLATQTAKVSFTTSVSKETSSDQNTATLSIQVENLAGHKFPTAYPSRRAWLEVVVRNQRGKVCFSSGTFDAKGRWIDRKGMLLPCEERSGPIQPHFQIVESDQQVQSYESFMVDTKDDLTFSLLRSAKFLKDNRILPKGWKIGHPDGIAIQPVGTDNDSSFKAGVDEVFYRFPAESGQYTVQIRLLFQSLSPRYLEELWVSQTPEVQSFRELYERSDSRPEVISSASGKLEIP